MCHKIILIAINYWHAFHTTSTTCHTKCLWLYSLTLCDVFAKFTKNVSLILKLWFSRILLRIFLHQWCKSELCNALECFPLIVLTMPSPLMSQASAVSQGSWGECSTGGTGQQICQLSTERSVTNKHDKCGDGDRHHQSRWSGRDRELSDIGNTLQHDESRSRNSLSFKAWWNPSRSRHLETW